MSDAKVATFQKRLDMPEGMDVCVSYEMFMRHVNEGRAVGITAITREDGSPGTYIYSGELSYGKPPKLEDKNDPDGWKHNCVRMVVGARIAALKAGCRPKT